MKLKSNLDEHFIFIFKKGYFDIIISEANKQQA